MALVAGETSGDILASMLIQGIQARWESPNLYGIGGPQMDRLGFHSWWPIHKLAVRGYVEVLRHYSEIVDIRNQLMAKILHHSPDMFIGIDAPDFNLDLAAQLKKKGIPTIQFVCPSIWAWRANRVEKIKRSVDHVLCLFPFEPSLLKEHGIQATYVGHPLARVIPDVVDKNAARLQLGIQPEALVLGLLPGSRQSEIKQLTLKFLKAANILAKRHSSLTVVLPMAPGVESEIQHMAIPFHTTMNLKLIQGQSHAVMAAADVTLIASGTATLEAALFKCPMVIAYAMPWLSWQIMKRQRLQPWVGLPNILCEEFVVPELLQSAAHPMALANAVESWIEQPDKIHAMRDKFQAMHELLRQDTAGLATDAIAKILSS